MGADERRRPVVLVGGNMGRNDGVDYRARFAADFPDVCFISHEGDPEALERHIAEADAVFGHVPDRLLPAARRLRWVSSTGAGGEGFATEAYRARPDVAVTTASGVHVAAVPEQVLAMMLAFARRLPEQILNQRGPHRWYWPTGMFELEGQTLAVLGLGHIGAALARKARGLGMRVTGMRRSATPVEEGLLDRQYSPSELRDLLADADHVAITLPGTSETEHLIGSAELRAMKPTAYIYNVGRGRVIEPTSLLEALRGGVIAGAGLDVTEPEPLPPDHPLWDQANLILLNHYGGLTPRYGDRCYQILSDNLRRFLCGEELLNQVDRRLGY